MSTVPPYARDWSPPKNPAGRYHIGCGTAYQRCVIDANQAHVTCLWNLLSTLWTYLVLKPEDPAPPAESGD